MTDTKNFSLSSTDWNTFLIINRSSALINPEIHHLILIIIRCRSIKRLKVLEHDKKPCPICEILDFQRHTDPENICRNKNNEKNKKNIHTLGEKIMCVRTTHNTKKSDNKYSEFGRSKSK